MAATILLCLTGASFASENICGTTKEMMNAEFWVKGTKTAHETILAPAEVQALTAKIREAPGTFCTDILDYPDFLSREEFARKIKSYAARRTTRDTSERRRRTASFGGASSPTQIRARQMKRRSSASAPS